ncbi:hypothetical protein CC80DRAFT_493731 [Byssothecium circinans]|uniref:Uncharacterized protein n=1 Tax=Byssothecium circinans TaxID=147558 RepID=A0A6A5TSG2_9PLEO|nr:hypothetical protein CC80DRAFT_493731 [Byssothecium circinans]
MNASISYGASKPKYPDRLSFLDLSPELRNMIYELAFDPRKRVEVTVSAQHAPEALVRVNNNSCGLLASCRQVYYEACSTLLAVSSFVIRPSAYSSEFWAREPRITIYLANTAAWLRRIGPSRSEIPHNVLIELGGSCLNNHNRTKGQNGEFQLTRSDHNDDKLGCLVDFGPLVKLFWDSEQPREIHLVSLSPRDDTGIHNTAWMFDKVNTIFRALCLDQLCVKPIHKFLASIYIGLEERGGYLGYKYHTSRIFAESERAFVKSIGGSGISWLPGYRRNSLLDLPLKEQLSGPTNLPQELFNLPKALRLRIYEDAIAPAGVDIHLDAQGNPWDCPAMLTVSRSIREEVRKVYTGYKHTFTMEYSATQTSFENFSKLRHFAIKAEGACGPISGGTIRGVSDEQNNKLKRAILQLKFLVKQPTTLKDLRIGILGLIIASSHMKLPIVKVILGPDASSKVEQKATIVSQIRLNAKKYLADNIKRPKTCNIRCPQILADGEFNIVGFEALGQDDGSTKESGAEYTVSYIWGLL